MTPEQPSNAKNSYHEQDEVRQYSVQTPPSSCSINVTSRNVYRNGEGMFAEISANI